MKKILYKNPYYNGKTPLKIIKILENLNFNNLINKSLGTSKHEKPINFIQYFNISINEKLRKLDKDV